MIAGLITINTPRGAIILIWAEEGADLLISVGTDPETTVPEVKDRIGEEYEGFDLVAKRVCDVWLFHPQSELLQP
ncbi:hypothetical protein [Leptolyngbya sp. FACHB-16]|uniref:hypothetical protein n=1 Tax=unclassified Leptolyngbya TaxID=2650499 RepID=UPI001684E299|nr:hypothetical protein [Leptolyngbya sp. FACHB-16]MBD2153139.1 hypothetical protein [Leptolyngbya sp. FACHB-16]